ncbi:MAG TPA: TetR family transcriptional regulator C-terminal domain-containing protein [Dongiaceae bacterium]|nr:TetR family transcriptional regulator C-terminal domain-containing protein [Dongiaceae bacterium]
MQSRKKVPRFKREAPEKRRADLVQAAIRCLAEGGMAAFKMERIAAEAGVSLGLLSHYFKSKTELLTEVYRAALYDDVNRKITELDNRDAVGSAAERLCRVVDAIVDPDYLKPANLTVWLALWGEIVVNPELRLAHRTLYRSYLKSLSVLIGEVADQRQRRVNAAEIARSLQALIDGLFLERALDRQAVSHADFRRASYEFLELHLGMLVSPA